jgi:3-dehydro-L-gulonate 2-dehydrogenase
MRVSFNEMKNELKRVLVKKGVNEETAEKVADIHTQNSCDGVYSHGLNRFPRVIEYLEKGYINVNAKSTIEASFGALAIIDGNYGFGPINAQFCMNKAMELSDKYGIGCVSLKHNNHWMRGGAYGLQAAKKGYIGVCFTNAIPNMPMWGASDCRLGNNPLIIAVPYKDKPVVLDMAISQFSFGKIEEHLLNGTMLPVYGGFDNEGNLTKDPEKITESNRALPIGCWKGAGLSLVLDLIASLLSKGQSVEQIGHMDAENSVSQVFMAINPKHLATEDEIEKIVGRILEYVKGSKPVNENTRVSYPGERSAKVREDNLKNGIPVNEKIWNYVKSI